MNRSRSHHLRFLCCFLIVQAKAATSFNSSLKTARDALMLKAQQHKVIGNANDPIRITELPGYTGWPRNLVESKFQKCVLRRIGNKEVALAGPLNILHYDMSDSANIWTMSIACPNATAPAGRGLLERPLFYARAYGPAILVGSQKAVTLKLSDPHESKNYTETDISFFFKDPGLYTVEVVFESIFTPDVYSLPLLPVLPYEGFLLRDFPLILNVTSNQRLCESAKECNMPLCTSKNIEADLTSSSARWIVSGHMSFDDVESRKNVPKQVNVRYADGINRLGIFTDYVPTDCVLAPMKSAIDLLDACVEHTGLHFIFIGDSVTFQHERHFMKLLNNSHRYNSSVFSLGWGGIDKIFHNTSEKLLLLKQENSSYPKVFLFNAGLHEITSHCQARYNASDKSAVSCAEHYRQRFKLVLDFLNLHFPSDLKIFRTTNAAWMRWANFGFAWPPGWYQEMTPCFNSIRLFNDVALQVIRDSGYDVRVYDLFWMTFSRPDDTEIQPKNAAQGHFVHLGHDTLKVSLRKMITIVADYFGCLK